MTTLAYRDRIMAADRRVDGYGTFVGEMSKIRVVSGWLLGVCGLAAHVEEIEAVVAARIESGKPMKGVIGAAEYHRDDGVSGGILVSPDDRVFKLEMDKHGKVAASEKFGPFFADGSGADLAYGAMEMGASAHMAIVVAGKRDAHTGGAIDEIGLDDLAPARPYPPAQQQEAPERLHFVQPSRFNPSVPRRNVLEELAPVELTLRNAVEHVEVAGTHPLLTGVVMALGKAREMLADWVDEGIRITQGGSGEAWNNSAAEAGQASEQINGGSIDWSDPETTAALERAEAAALVPTADDMAWANAMAERANRGEPVPAITVDGEWRKVVDNPDDDPTQVRGISGIRSDAEKETV